MIAGFPMHLSASTDAAYDRLWAALQDQIRARGIDAPDAQTRPQDLLAFWTDPKLLIGQTCGFPFMKWLRDKARLVATPHYDVEGCDGPNYRSWLITHADSPTVSVTDLRGSRAAYNGTDSQSGYNAFRAIVAPHADGRSFFSETLASGTHRASMEMVADRRADCATIDVVSWAIACREAPELEQSLKIIGETPALPVLPYITAINTSDETVEILRASLFAVLDDPENTEILQTLLIKGASVLDETAYQPALDMEQDAIAADYPELV